MICPKCGKETPDESRFCLNCGERIEQAANSHAEDVPEIQVEEYPDFLDEEKETDNVGDMIEIYDDEISISGEEAAENVADSSVAEADIATPKRKSFGDIFRSVGKSGLFLNAAILYSVYVFFGFIYSAVSMNYMIAVAIVVSGGLLCPALWFIYASSKSTAPSENALTALTLFKTHTVIHIVCVSIVEFLLLFAAGIAMTGNEIIADIIREYADMPGVFYTHGIDDIRAFIIGVGVGMFIVALIVAAVYYVYMIYRLRIIKQIRRGLMGDTINEINGVGFYTVFTYIIAGFNFVSLVFSVPGLFYTYSVMNLFLSAMDIAFSVLTAVLLVKLNYKLKTQSTQNE